MSPGFQWSYTDYELKVLFMIHISGVSNLKGSEGLNLNSVLPPAALNSSQDPDIFTYFCLWQESRDSKNCWHICSSVTYNFLGTYPAVLKKFCSCNCQNVVLFFWCFFFFFNFP